MSIFIAAVIGLVVIAVIAIPILISVFRSAAERNPNRPEADDQTRQERESGEQHR